MNLLFLDNFLTESGQEIDFLPTTPALAFNNL